MILLTPTNHVQYYCYWACCNYYYICALFLEGWGVKIPRANFHPRGANFSVPVPWARCRPGPGVSRVFLVCFSRGRAFRIAAFFVFLLPGAQVSLVRVPQDALSFRSCCPGTYVSHCCVFPFLHPGVAFLSALLLSFWQSLSARFAFFSFIQVSAFPFSLVDIPACAFRVAFFSLPRGVRFPLRPGACVSFFVWRPGARVLHCGFFHIYNPAFRRSRAKKKKHLGKTPKHSNAKRTLRDDEK